MKPIVVITTSLLTPYDNDKFENALRDCKIREEYYVFLIGSPLHEGAPKWEVFYEKDFNEIKYKALKTLIEMKLMNNSKVVIKGIKKDVPEIAAEEKKSTTAVEEIPNCESCGNPMVKGTDFYHCVYMECNKGGTL